MEIIFNNLSYVSNKKTSYETKYLDKVNLIIKSGTIAGFLNNDLSIIGELLTLIKRPSSGELKLGKAVIKRTSHINNVNLLKKKIGFVYTKEYLFKHDTVKEEIKSIMKQFNFKTNNISKHISDSLSIVLLNDSYLERNPNNLSYTEKKKLLLAMVLSYNPEVIIMDQFFKGMIARDIKYFKNLFIKLKNKYNKTIIFISNSIEDMFNLIDEVYVISSGELKVLLDKNEFYNDEVYKYNDMPKIIEFTKYAQEEGHNILNYTDNKELLKELYRKC